MAGWGYGTLYLADTGDGGEVWITEDQHGLSLVYEGRGDNRLWALNQVGNDGWLVENDPSAPQDASTQPSVVEYALKLEGVDRISTVQQWEMRRRR